MDLPVLPDPFATRRASPFRSIGRDYLPVVKSRAAVFVDFARHN